MTAREEVQQADEALREAQIALMVGVLRELAHEINDHEPGRGRHALWLIHTWEQAEAERAKEKL